MTDFYVLSLYATDRFRIERVNFSGNRFQFANVAVVKTLAGQLGDPRSQLHRFSR